MAARKKRASVSDELVDAAGALGTAFDAYVRAASEFNRLRLDRRSEVAKASSLLSDVARHDQEVADALARLVAAITATRDAREGPAQEVARRAEQVLEKGRVLEALMAALSGIVDEIKQTNAALAEARKTRGPDAVVPILDRIVKLADRAQAFALEAKARTFADLADEAHDLRQQLLQLHNKASLLAKKMPQT